MGKIFKIGNKEFTRNYKDGDRVEVKCYADVMIVDGIDESLTEGLNEVHYWVWSEKYLEGISKSSTGEPCTEKEMTLLPPKKIIQLP